MLKNITLGQYFPGDSFIHRLDPRTKLLATVALIAIVFVAQGFSGFLLIAAFIISCAASTGIHLKYLVRGLKPIMFIIIFTFVLLKPLSVVIRHHLAQKFQYLLLVHNSFKFRMFHILTVWLCDCKDTTFYRNMKSPH
jgi:energy-coupling factor transporter transmembrane protein EcfT